MQEDYAELISAYLDGELTAEQSGEVERHLLEPAMRSALARELALRDWLQSVGPDTAPPDLLRELERAVVAEGKRSGEGRKLSALSALWAALSGTGSVARGLVAAGARGNAAIGAGQSVWGAGRSVYGAGRTTVTTGAGAVRLLRSASGWLIGKPKKGGRR